MIPINEPYADGKCVQSSSGTPKSPGRGASVGVSEGGIVSPVADTI